MEQILNERLLVKRGVLHILHICGFCIYVENLAKIYSAYKCISEGLVHKIVIHYLESQILFDY
jgi:hypothetical protein